MANPTKGTVGVNFNGQRLDLALTFNAICQIEDLSGQPMGEILMAADRGDFRILRVIVWGSFLQSKPEITVPEAGDFCESQGGDLPELVQRIISTSGLLSAGGDTSGNAKKVKALPKAG